MICFEYGNIGVFTELLQEDIFGGISEDLIFSNTQIFRLFLLRLDTLLLVIEVIILHSGS